MPHKHPEKRREYQRNWHAANRDRSRESSRKWREANPEKVLAISRKWHAANPEKVREAQRRRMAEIAKSQPLPSRSWGTHTRRRALPSIRLVTVRDVWVLVTSEESYRITDGGTDYSSRAVRNLALLTNGRASYLPAVHLS